MMLSGLQEPPLGLGASARMVTGPPVAGTFLRWPSAKNARNFPSEDQNGKEARSVPSIFFAARSLRDCTQMNFSFSERAQKAMAVPSTRITGGPEKSPVKSKLVSAGGGRKERKTRAGSRSRKYDQPRSASKAATRAAHGKFCSKRLRRSRVGGGAAVAPLPAIQRNSRAISAAFCQRASGSLARHSVTT